jgi:hypothetical protein
MVHFGFFSHDPYEVIMSYLQELDLGVLDDVYRYETSTGTHYLVCYHRITCDTFAKVIQSNSGVYKLIYGENEYGYPKYWYIWW